MDRIVVKVAPNKPIVASEFLEINIFYVFSYDPIGQALYFYKLKEGVVPGDSVGLPGKDVVVLSEPEDAMYTGNLPCYDLLDTVGMWNRVGIVKDILYVEGE